LSWGGADWQWQTGESQPLVGTVGVMIDLGGWMLLRFESAAASRRVNWLAVSRRQSAGLWPAWRAALYSRRPSEGRTDPGRPA